ncbi:MAG: hypothetical protein ACJAVZ_001702 [Afipia broomeae]|jgi:hypothetical protein
MPKVKIGLIAKRFVTNSKLIPKRRAHRELQDAHAPLQRSQRLELPVQRVFHRGIQPAFMSRSGNTSKCRTRQFLPGAV